MWFGVMANHKKQGNPAKSVLICTLALILASAAARGQTAAPPSPAEPSQRVILVSLSDRKLAVIEDGHVLRVFQVAVGAQVSPSPEGDFHITHRLEKPTYYHPGLVIPPGPENPLGTRWVGLDKKGFGIHGTNQPWSVGKAASHGCIRLRNKDMEKLFALVRLGDVVEIRGERDAQIAQVFGGTAPAAVVAQAQVAVTVAVGQ